MKKSRVLILTILVMAAAVVWVVPWIFGRHNAAQEDISSHPVLHCESCKFIFRSVPRQLPPLPCPQCGKETAYRAELAQCTLCQTFFPLTYYKWSADEKAKWEKRLPNRPLTPDEHNELYRAQLAKTPSGDWMSAESLAQQSPTLLCPKCGNQDPSKIMTHVQPPAAETVTK